jgi:hypothetical protein
MNYLPGMIVLFNWNSTFFTKLIEKYNYSQYGKSYCTHAGIIIEDLGNGKVLIAEPINLKEGIIHIAKPKISLVNLKETYSTYEGTPYGVLDLFSIGLFWLLKIKLDLTKASSIICSEGVIRMCYDASNKKINLEEEFDKPFSLITPMDIFLSKQFIIYGKYGLIDNF